MFDLKQSDLSAPFDAADVILSDGEATLYFNHAQPPGIEWTSFKIPLDASAGWLHQDTDKAAGPDKLNQVLSRLTKLWIRGEFRTGDDTGGLDNVAIR